MIWVLVGLGLLLLSSGSPVVKGTPGVSQNPLVGVSASKDAILAAQLRGPVAGSYTGNGIIVNTIMDITKSFRGDNP